MWDAGLHDISRTSILDAVSARARQTYDDTLDTLCDTHVEAGGTEEDWDPPNFDEGPAWAECKALAERAMSHDPKEIAAAYATIRDLGRDPLSLMSEAYRTYESSVAKHEDWLPDLEKRRREVRRDYDLLQNARPLDGEVIEG